MLWGSALRGLGTTRPFAIEHCRNTVGLGTYVAMGTAGILWGWALKGYLLLGAAGILRECCWSLRDYCAVVGHCRDTLRLLLVTGWILIGWAL